MLQGAGHTIKLNIVLSLHKPGGVLALLQAIPVHLDVHGYRDAAVLLACKKVYSSRSTTEGEHP